MGSTVALAFAGGVLIVITLIHTTAGMALAAIAFLFAGGTIASVATGGIHEATASILLIGSALCAGFAGLSRDMQKVRPPAASPPITVEPPK